MKQSSLGVAGLFKTGDLDLGQQQTHPAPKKRGMRKGGALRRLGGRHRRVRPFLSTFQKSWAGIESVSPPIRRTVEGVRSIPEKKMQRGHEKEGGGKGRSDQWWLGKLVSGSGGLLVRCGRERNAKGREMPYIPGEKMPGKSD